MVNTAPMELDHPDVRMYLLKVKQGILDASFKIKRDYPHLHIDIDLSRVNDDERLNTGHATVDILYNSGIFGAAYYISRLYRPEHADMQLTYQFPEGYDMRALMDKIAEGMGEKWEGRPYGELG